MKKVIITLLLVLCVVAMPIVNAKAKTTKAGTKEVNNDVKIYLFFASWCSHCHDFISYFSDKYMDYKDSFEIVAYRVDENTTNSNLMAKMGEVLGRDGSGIPFIIIGDWYQSGFGSDGSNLIEKALEAKTDKNYKDVVAETIKSQKLDNDPMEFSEVIKLVSADETENSTNEDVTEKGNDTLIVIIVFAVIILGFGGLFLYSRKD